MSDALIIEIINNKLRVIKGQLNSVDEAKDSAKAHYLRGGFDVLNALKIRIIEG